MRSFLIYVMLFPFLIYTSSCKGQALSNSESSELVFVGSTPGAAYSAL